MNFMKFLSLNDDIHHYLHGYQTVRDILDFLDAMKERNIAQKLYEVRIHNIGILVIEDNEWDQSEDYTYDAMLFAQYNICIPSFCFSDGLYSKSNWIFSSMQLRCLQSVEGALGDNEAAQEITWNNLSTLPNLKQLTLRRDDPDLYVGLTIDTDRLSNYYTLTALCIHEFQLDLDDVLRGILNGLPMLTSLDIASCQFQLPANDDLLNGMYEQSSWQTLGQQLLGTESVVTFPKISNLCGTTKSVFVLSHYCPNVTSLKIFGNDDHSRGESRFESFSSDYLDYQLMTNTIAKRYNRLSTLELKCCWCNSVHNRMLFIHNPSLTSVTLSGRECTIGDLVAMAKCCPNIKLLSLSRLPSYREDNDRLEVQSALQDIGTISNEELLSSIYADEFDPFDGFEVVLGLLRNNRNLKELRSCLALTSMMSDQGLKYFRELISIETLSIWSFHRAAQQSYADSMRFIPKLVNLRIVHISGCVFPSYIFEEFIKACGKLDKLEVSYHINIPRDHLATLAAYGKTIRFLRLENSLFDSKREEADATIEDVINMLGTVPKLLQFRGRVLGDCEEHMEAINKAKQEGKVRKFLKIEVTGTSPLSK